jgi:hypothetical protein
VSRSVVSGNSQAGVFTTSGAQVLVENTEVTHNLIGVSAAGSAPSSLTVLLANSDIFFNGTGISGAGSASYGNNRIFGNTSAGSSPFTGGASTDHGQQ